MCTVFLDLILCVEMCLYVTLNSLLQLENTIWCNLKHIAATWNLTVCDLKHLTATWNYALMQLENNSLRLEIWLYATLNKNRCNLKIRLDATWNDSMRLEIWLRATWNTSLQLENCELMPSRWLTATWGVGACILICNSCFCMYVVGYVSAYTYIYVCAHYVQKRVLCMHMMA